jgi:hypothetical protein
MTEPAAERVLREHRSGQREPRALRAASLNWMKE